MKLNLPDWFFRLVLIMLIGIMIILIVQLKNEQNKCIMSPMMYAVKHFPGNMSCNCRFEDERYSSFVVSKEGIVRLKIIP